jgi:zinc transport system substrate-binding protein
MIPSVFHDADEPAGSLDPHIWLDFDNANIMAQNIAKVFETAKPGESAFFNQNLKVYAKELADLDQAFKNTLSRCRSKELIYGGHYAFGYLAGRYGLKYLAAQGVSPDAEPTAKDLARLVDQIKKDKVKFVFYEELTSPKIAETIASETKANMLLLNAGHNITRDQFEQGVSFFSILKTDLENLRTGLECR